ncbi:hypothetical protein BUALT_Bualt07G0113000 [Buddleja alternifolia]|uniref:Uncharacterized protein n=1 Tax=Buddleja alternifolia TaxID=168488 RepID=A0AAV6XAW2_9LAMI|nr:hypothetical protein BUALT_Bualt07G0113000 [Buddleja alternifolia]
MDFTKALPSLNLLRVLDVVDKYSPEEITKLSSPRYLAFRPDLTGCNLNPEIISSMFVHWNVQTFKTEDFDVIVSVPPQIWETTELRHLEFRMIRLPDPPPESHNFYMLENLYTLLYVYNFRCTEEVVKRVPNLRKLQILYNDDDDEPSGVEWSYYCLNNLVRLHKLESLSLAMGEKGPRWDAPDGDLAGRIPFGLAEIPTLRIILLRRWKPSLSLR